jgi:hypothetical protein
MKTDQQTMTSPQRWARFRFAVIGTLLSAPPPAGERQAALQQLADREWQHPLSGQPLRLGLSTIERWYYRARETDDPFAALRQQTRSDAGSERCFGILLKQALRDQFERHKGWSIQLHVDNLRALVAERPELAAMPSYATIRRFMRANGLHKQKTIRRVRETVGTLAAEKRLQQREVRSYEMDHVHGLWLMPSSRLCGVDGGRSGKSNTSAVLSAHNQVDLSIAINASGTLKCPGTNEGGTTAINASSFSVGSTRTYI